MCGAERRSAYLFGIAAKNDEIEEFESAGLSMSSGSSIYASVQMLNTAGTECNGGKAL